MIFSTNFTFKSYAPPSTRPESPSAPPVTFQTSMPKFSLDKHSKGFSISITSTTLRPSYPSAALRNVENSVPVRTSRPGPVQRKTSHAITIPDRKSSLCPRIDLDLGNQNFEISFSSLDSDHHKNDNSNRILSLARPVPESQTQTRTLTSTPVKQQQEEARPASGKGSIGFPSIQRKSITQNSTRPVPEDDERPSLTRKLSLNRTSTLPIVSRQSLRRLRTSFHQQSPSQSSTNASSTSESLTGAATLRDSIEEPATIIQDTPRRPSSSRIPAVLESPSVAENFANHPKLLNSNMHVIREAEEMKTLSRFRRFSQACTNVLSLPESISNAELHNRTMEVGENTSTKKRFWSSSNQRSLSLSDSISAFPLPPPRTLDQPKTEPIYEESEQRRSYCPTVESDHLWKAPNIYGRMSCISRQLSTSHSTDSDSSSVLDRPESQPKFLDQDPFGTFSAMTRPRTKSTDQVSKAVRRQRKEFEFAHRMEQGAYFSTSDEDSDSDDDDDGEVAPHDGLEYRNPFWAHNEDDYEDDGRWQIAPPLTPDVSQHRDSIFSHSSSFTSEGAITPTTPTSTDLEAYRQATAFSLETKKLRRRTCSSECLMLEAVENLRSILRDGETPCNEFATHGVEEEDCVDNKLMFVQKEPGYFKGPLRIITSDNEQWSG